MDSDGYCAGVIAVTHGRNTLHFDLHNERAVLEVRPRQQKGSESRETCFYRSLAEVSSMLGARAFGEVVDRSLAGTLRLAQYGSVSVAAGYRVPFFSEVDRQV